VQRGPNAGTRAANVNQEHVMKIKHCSALALAGTTLVAGAMTMAATPAQAATNTPCMSNSEWSRIDRGMTQAQVKRIVGSTGKITFQWHDASYPSLNEVDREWRRCGLASYHTATVVFEGAGLTFKGTRYRF